MFKSIRISVLKKGAFPVLLAAALVLSGLSESRAQAFGSGTKFISAGLRLQNYFTPIFASAEFAVSEKIGVGGQFWFASRNGVSIFAPGAFGNYHFPINNEKLDVYAGAGLNFWRVSYRDYYYGYSSASTTFTTFGIQGGARYFFSDNWGVLGQLNLDFVSNSNYYDDASSTNAVLTVGATYKF